MMEKRNMKKDEWAQFGILALLGGLSPLLVIAVLIIVAVVVLVMVNMLIQNIIPIAIAFVIIAVIPTLIRGVFKKKLGEVPQ